MQLRQGRNTYRVRAKSQVAELEIRLIMSELNLSLVINWVLHLKASVMQTLARVTQSVLCLLGIVLRLAFELYFGTPTLTSNNTDLEESTEIQVTTYTIQTQRLIQHYPNWHSIASQTKLNLISTLTFLSSITSLTPDMMQHWCHISLTNTWINVRQLAPWHWAPSKSWVWTGWLL